MIRLVTILALYALMFPAWIRVELFRLFAPTGK